MYCSQFGANFPRARSHDCLGAPQQGPSDKIHKLPNQEHLYIDVCVCVCIYIYIMYMYIHV